LGIKVVQASRQRLEQYITSESGSLLKTLRYYVMRAGLATGSGVGQVADEILNETVVEAFATAERLKTDIHPKPWLLGIAANLVKRRQSELAKRERREPLMRDLYAQTQDTLSDEELFDLISQVTEESLEALEDNEQVTRMLAGLSESDAELLRLAILYDMDGSALGKTLGISSGAARVRLHRALNRLRLAMQARSGNYE
jgi:RNA polymerase sigma-70 factor (ECF subfamily)